MLTIHFNENSAVPMYETIYENIKHAILNHELKAHEKLPSKRALAQHLKISVITIENAYEQLIIEGYITSIEKRGYFVNEINTIENKPAEPISLEPKIGNPYEIDLLTNAISADQFPIALWSKYTRNALKYNNSEILAKCPGEGYLPLREAIAFHLHSFMGMNVDASQIIIGAGTEYLYNIVLQLLGKDKTYALEDPGHQSIYKVYSINNVKVDLLPLDGSGLSLDALSHSNADVIHISSAHHYPTGITMPIKRRMELLKLMKERNGTIIEDDYDSEFRLKGKPIPPIFQIDKNECVIYMNTFSKTLSPSLRISYMVLPDSLLRKYKDKLSFYSCPVSLLDQITLSHFIRDGHFERHINRMRHYYKEIRDELLQQLSTCSFYHDIIIKEENAGLHFLLEYPYNISDTEMIELAKKHHIKLGTLSHYSYKKEDSHTLIINYTGLSHESIPLAISKLDQLFDDIRM